MCDTEAVIIPISDVVHDDRLRNELMRHFLPIDFYFI